MKTQKAVETHNAIVEAAKQLFMVKEINKVTVSEITKKAGVAKGTFYVYFESKDELVWHFIDQELGSVLEWFETFIDYGYEKEDIEAIVDFLIYTVKKNIVALKIMHKVRFLKYLGEDRLRAKYIHNLIIPVSVWIEKGKSLGKLDIYDARFTAIFMVNAIHGMIDEVINETVPYTIDNFGEKIKPLLLKLLK